MGKKAALLAVALAVAGLCILLWPVVSGHRLQADMSAAAQGFLEEARQSYPELLADLQGYNQRIYTERQAGLADALACEEPAVLLRDYGVEDEIIGVLEIPTLELVMPVYLGASDSHLAAGAAVLGNTSAPIGGVNTNCVIAGHRGWYGADYFRHIDRLQAGDIVTITNLWETLTYAVVDMKMQDVSTAVYRAVQKQLVSGDVMLQKLLECLNGKGITSAGHLSARNFSFGEEIIESDGKLNFYLQADFDVDAAFGTFVCTDQNDDWLNIYANYDIEKGRPCDTLELNLCKGDGTEENWSYHLNAAEQEVLARKMEDYCQQQTGMSLHEYARQLRESGSQTPEMQM